LAEDGDDEEKTCGAEHIQIYPRSALGFRQEQRPA
jgi:hypothetical protein